MTGWEHNDDPASFWQADLDEAAERLAILREEQADVIVLYDWHGGYGHPDQTQVHRAASRRRSGRGDATKPRTTGIGSPMMEANTEPRIRPERSGR